MARIAEPGGYQREAGVVFGSGILRSCPACGQMPCTCYACECCGGNEAAGLKRCAACYELCTRGYSCRVPGKGAEA